MFRRRLLAVATAVGLGFSLIHRLTVTRAQTPAPGFFDAAGIELDFIADSAPLTIVPALTRVGVQRISVAPGGFLEATYFGPVLFAVERGTLTVRHWTEQMRITRGGSSTGGPVRRQRLSPTPSIGEPRTVAAGEALSVGDGNLGRVENQGPDATIVLAVLLVDEAANRAGMVSEGSEEIAQPDPTRAP